MILGIGDSNLYPACTESDQPIDSYNMMPAFSYAMEQPFRCWAKNGASNYWIETHLDYFLADPTFDKDTMLFIGWTSFEREEWPWLYNNISICGGPDFGMPEPMKPKFNQWKTTLTGEYYRKMTQFWHDRIYQIHLNLRERGVRHLFWTTYNNFKEIANQQDWHGNFFQPYDANGCMGSFFAANGIQAIEDDMYHYGPDGHMFWAKTLSDHAKSNNL